MVSLSDPVRVLTAPRWLLALIFALIAANLIEVAGTLATTQQYIALQLPFPPILRVVIAGGWVIVLAILLLRLIHHDPKALSWTAPILTLDAVSGLVWFIVFARSDYDRGRIGFQIALALVTLLPVWLNWFIRHRHDTSPNT